MQLIFGKDYNKKEFYYGRETQKEKFYENLFSRYLKPTQVTLVPDFKLILLTSNSGWNTKDNFLF
jgi:hypothetical protein